MASPGSHGKNRSLAALNITMSPTSTPKLYLNHGNPQRLVVEFEKTSEESVQRVPPCDVASLMGEAGSYESVSYARDSLLTEGLPAPDTLAASRLSSIRLHQVANLVESDNINKEDIAKNLRYAISVLETLYTEETRRLCDEDDGLDEVRPDAVPTEVRDWLTQTFTRVHSTPKRNGERFRFKSVAQALTAGILVDKLYRRMSSGTTESLPVAMVLKTINQWNFNVFELHRVSESHALKVVGHEILRKQNIISRFKIKTVNLELFLLALERGYSKHGNPYHNLLHGADVAQTAYQMLTSSRLVDWLTDLEVFAGVIAALIHDYEHTGTTNSFHVKTKSDLAMLYNDRSVLENMHVCGAFRLMEEPTTDILSGLSKEEYVEFRSLVIDMVLATDMTSHFQQMKTMKSLLSCPENIERSKALSLVIHTADISHAAKEWSLHSKWTDRLMEEFFKQGDREKELDLPCSPLCDRKTTLIGQSQIGFINFILEPTFSILGDMLDGLVHPQSQQTMSDDPNNPAEERKRVDKPWEFHLEDNKDRWQEVAGVSEDKQPEESAPEKVENGESGSKVSFGLLKKPGIPKKPVIKPRPKLNQGLKALTEEEYQCVYTHSD